MLRLVFTVMFFSMIFVLLGFNQEAEAASMTFTMDTTILSDQTILAGETWTINPGVTVTFNPGINLINHGSLINNGILILNGDGTPHASKSWKKP